MMEVLTLIGVTWEVASDVHRLWVANWLQMENHELVQDFWRSWEVLGA